MSGKFYKSIIDESTGYALHKIILDDKGKPVDYVFIDVNETFEKYTGLKRKVVLNERITKILPNINKDEFNWISFYGEIAIGGRAREIEQYSKPLDRYYHIKVFSPRMGYFVTLFTDVTIEMKVADMSRWMLEQSDDKIDYEKIMDDMLIISEAKYGIFKLFDSNGRDFTTVAVSGVSNNIKKAERLLGFNIVGKKWKYKNSRDEKTNGKSVACFDTLGDLSGKAVSGKIIESIEKKFNTGQVIIVKIMNGSNILGDITLIMEKGARLNRFGLVEMYASQIGLFLEKKRLDNELMNSHNRMELAMKASENGLWDWNIATGDVYINSGFKKMIGYDENDLENNIDSIFELMHTDDKRDVLPRIMDHIEKVQPYEEEFRFKCKNGNWKWISGRGKSYDIDDNGKPNRVVGMNVDISRIKEESQKYDKIFRNNPAIMAVSSLPDKLYTEVNDAFLEATGYSEDEIVGKSYKDLGIFILDDQLDVISKVLGEEIAIREFNLKLKTKDGRILDVILSGECIESEGKKCYLTMMIDITELRKSQDRIEHMSYHDQLTGLYNRRFYETELKRLDTNRNLPLSIIMIDVNGLKLVNDAFGHNKGDELLVKVADSIKEECRADEIIARLGGDEFVVLLPNTGMVDAEMIADRVAVRTYSKNIGLINISVSCGVGTKESEESVIEIFKKAEESMYKKKLFDSQVMRKKTIEKIMLALYEMNSVEEGHSKNVAKMSGKLAKACGLKTEKIVEIYESGRMHDIGKIAVAPSILSKDSALNDIEMSQVRTHSEVGYQILRSVNEYALMSGYILTHHERWDGSGYPGGLKANDIPLESRIIGIADSFDAMINDRPYRKALSIDEAVEELNRCSGTQFDPELTRVFIENVLGQMI